VFSLCVVCIFNLSSVLYIPACINVNGTVLSNCADVPLSLLTHSLISVTRDVAVVDTVAGRADCVMCHWVPLTL